MRCLKSWIKYTKVVFLMEVGCEKNVIVVDNDIDIRIGVHPGSSIPIAE
jgi:hypothetical protein